MAEAFQRWRWTSIYNPKTAQSCIHLPSRFRYLGLGKFAKIYNFTNAVSPRRRNVQTNRFRGNGASDTSIDERLQYGVRIDDRRMKRDVKCDMMLPDQHFSFCQPASASAERGFSHLSSQVTDTQQCTLVDLIDLRLISFLNRDI